MENILVAGANGTTGKKIVNLLKLMAQKGRLALLPQLSNILNKEVRVASNKFTGTVESSEEIDAALIEKLEKKLSDYSKAEIKLESKKSDDIDGIKVEVSDLGLELNFSKASVKKALLEHIAKAL